MKIQEISKETKKLIKLTDDKAIYEDGWWMTKKDWEFANSSHTYGKVKVPNKNLIGWDRDKETKQLTYFILPS